MIPVINAAFAIENFIEGTRTDKERMAQLMKKGEFLLAEEAGCVIACLYMEQRGDRGYFGMLAVDPHKQGQGLGRTMVEAAETHCCQRGCRHMDINVLSLCTELPAFYKKLGYVQTGTEEFHPSRPLKPGVECHCIIMSKKL